MKKASLLPRLALALFALFFAFSATAVTRTPKTVKKHVSVSLRQFSESSNADLEKLLGKKPGWKERLAYGLLKKRLKKAIRENPALGELSFDGFVSDCSKIKLYDGTVIDADIVKITATRIVYRRCGKPDTPEIDIPKTDVASVEEANGKIIYQRSGRESASYDGQPQTDSTATWALTCAIAGFFFFPLSLVGFVLGLISLGKIDRQPGRYKGRGMAIAAIVIGALFLLAVLLLIMLLL